MSENGQKVDGVDGGLLLCFAAAFLVMWVLHLLGIYCP